MPTVARFSAGTQRSCLESRRRLVAVPVPIAIVVPIVFAPIAVAVAIPAMVVLEATAIPFPITAKKTFSIMMGPDPARARVRRTCPVSVMPPIAVAGYIPVAIHPDKIGAGARREDAYDARRRWRADSDSDGNLRAANRCYGQKHQREEYILHGLPFRIQGSSTTIAKT